MDDVIAFLKKYVKAEKDAYVASFQEADAAKFEAKLERAQEFYWEAPGGTLEMSLGQPDDAGDKEAYGDADKKEGRHVFLVKKYDHPKLGELYAAWASSARPRFAVSYGEILYVARKDGELKIISRYKLGMPGPGRDFEHLGGEEIDDPGEPVEVRKLEAPEKPDDKADYDAA
jgi:hypothetical protein